MMLTKFSNSTKTVSNVLKLVKSVSCYTIRYAAQVVITLFVDINQRNVIWMILNGSLYLYYIDSFIS